MNTQKKRRLDGYQKTYIAILGIFVVTQIFDAVSTYQAVCIDGYQEVNLTAIKLVQFFGFLPYHIGVLAFLTFFMVSGTRLLGTTFKDKKAFKIGFIGLLCVILLAPFHTVINNSLTLTVPHPQAGTVQAQVAQAVNQVTDEKVLVTNGYGTTTQDKINYAEKLADSFDQKKFCQLLPF